MTSCAPGPQAGYSPHAGEPTPTPSGTTVHLSNAYRKLGARSRHDLAGLLERDSAPA